MLSLTLVAVQLAMGQFSPRIVRAILHDRRSQLAVGLFIGTFAYSMTVLREVNGQSSGGGPLPGLAIVVDYGLILSAIVVLALYMHHTAQSIRVTPTACWSSCPRWAISCPGAGRCSVCRARFRNRTAARPRAA